MLDEFVRREVIKFGDFQLSSGERSPYYVDMRLVLSYPDLLRWVIAKYTNILRDINFDLLVGVATGGIPYASILGFSMYKPIAYVRERAKWYGTKRDIEGAVWEGARAVLIDDVITTGQSVIQAINKLKEVGARVESVVVFLDREQCGAKRVEKETGVPVRPVYKILDILQEIKDLIGEDKYKQIYNYTMSFKC
ncbi:orotate phosphoribosyltransferase [Thermoproteus tenax]|uniref:Orotate phosphoribosyltransferase n=1 Tax=Thermoproteus tenax (strain ATCC 35583 / DSM 2078 / JCM 9277 / NBRC 100435 / Kra 1) TaxID=768679 RepID=G4RPF7_THETK|nr:orotate phosphoribosyltransferase [Thermoproteus tenax]CCC81452.1 Orotate phosphoribosyltransferase [Thermoproteus tenax Kra 1]